MQVLTFCLLCVVVSTLTTLVVNELLREPPRPTGLGGLWRPARAAQPPPSGKLNFTSLKIGDREKLIRNGWMNEDGTPTEKFLLGRGPRG